MFSPHCSSPCTRTTAHLKTPPSSSWSLQPTPHWSASFRTVTSLLTDRSLRSWQSGAVLTWSLTHSKQWRWSWTSVDLINNNISRELFELLPSGRRYRNLRTETVSFPKQSISWTLDIKRGTHNIIIQLFIHHILIFSFQICTCQTSHIIFCIVYCIFDILYIAYFVYLHIVLFLSVSCHCHSVALWSFCHYNKLFVFVNISGK